MSDNMITHRPNTKSHLQFGLENRFLSGDCTFLVIYLYIKLPSELLKVIMEIHSNAKP